MDLAPLVFDVGDLVGGCGEIVRDADGIWLDPPHVIGLGFSTRPPRRSPYAVRLTGADPAVVGVAVTGSSLPGWAFVTGIWSNEGIAVRSQSATLSASFLFRYEHQVPPCPAPPGGWPMSSNTPDTTPYAALTALTQSGAAVGITTFRRSQHQSVMVVAATDVDAVEAALRPQLGVRLCVVVSRWTREQLDRISAQLEGQWDHWTVNSMGHVTDDGGQVSLEARVFRVGPDMAAWAGGLPDGILAVKPGLYPIRQHEQPPAG